MLKDYEVESAQQGAHDDKRRESNPAAGCSRTYGRAVPGSEKTERRRDCQRQRRASVAHQSRSRLLADAETDQVRSAELLPEHQFIPAAVSQRPAGDSAKVSARHSSAGGFPAG